MTSGVVYWLTGVSGAGKTTLGRELHARLRSRGEPVIFLDGDSLRSAVAEDLAHTREDRLRCALRYSRLCALLAEQGVSVVIATISMFREVHAENRRIIRRYREIYLRTPIEVARRRDPKGLYAAGRDMVGESIAADEPQAPDLVLNGDGSAAPSEMAERILRELSGRE